MRPRHHAEHHLVGRIGWMRAAVLGANDGILSTASLITGVAAADTTHTNVLIAGIAGLVAGAMSMAAGEYVSVSSQADTEQADLSRERQELAEDIAGEREELGISEITTARPVQAALTSAATFAAGAAMPLLAAVLSPTALLIPVVTVASLIFLCVLGAVGAIAGGANVWRAAGRVAFWGAFAMALTAGIGALVGANL